MKNTKILLTALAVIVLCCALIFAACVDAPQNPEIPKLSITINDFAYTGDEAVPQIDSGNLEYNLIWYSVSDAGELTSLDSAPTIPGKYKVVATLKNYEGVEAFADFTINKAETTVDIEDLSKIYDGSAVEAKYTTNSNSTDISLKYRCLSPVETLWEDEAPSAKGEYEVRVIVKENSFYKGADVIAKFSINEISILTLATSYVDVEFFVSEENKVLSINATSEEGNLLKNLLNKQNAIGKTVNEVAELSVSILKEEGYLLHNEDIKLKSDNTNLGNIGKKAVDDKLQELNISSGTTLEEYTEDDVIDNASFCLRELSQDEIKSLGAAALKARLYDLRKLTANFENNDAKDLFYVLRAKTILSIQLEAIKNTMETSNANYSLVESELNNLASIESLLPEFKTLFLGPTGNSYPCTALRDTRMCLKAAIDNNDSLSVAKYEFLLNYESFETAPYRISEMAQMFEILGNASELVEDLLTIQVDLKALDEFVKNYNEVYAKYIAVNYWTLDNLFIDGTLLYSYQSEIENKTYAIAESNNPSYADLLGFTYEFDGLISNEDILTATPTRIDFAAVITDYNNQPINEAITTLAEEVHIFYSFFVSQDSIELKYVEGEIEQLIVLPHLIFDCGPVTIVFSTVDDQLKAYFYFDALTIEEINTRPCIDMANCYVDEEHKKVIVSNGFYTPAMTFNIETSGAYTPARAEGTIVFNTAIDDPQNSGKCMVFQCNTVNAQNILYMQTGNIGYKSDLENLCYSEIGTWEATSEKLWAYIGEYTYIFRINGDSLVFDKFVYGD